MNIRKLPSGNWQIRETRDGHTYSVTIDHEPGMREAKKLMDRKIDETVEKISRFGIAAEKYIDAKSNVLSPSTLKAYNSMRKSIPEWFNKKDLTEIDNPTLQRLVNEMSADHSAKYTGNVYGFATAVIRFWMPESTAKATTPKKPHKDEYIPSAEDVRKLFKEAINSEYYVALRLASMSLRRSEIFALTVDDLDGDYITINKGMVQDRDGIWIVKPTPKTDRSNRTIAIPHDLAERIRTQGYVYKCTPNGIDNYMRRTLKRLGIPWFSLHKLRHFFASYAHELGYTDAQIMELGGWETDNVMKSVYRHAMNKDDAKIQIANDFDL